MGDFDNYLNSSYDYLEAELLNLLFITVTPKYKNSNGIPPEFFKEDGTTLFIYKIIRKLYKEQRKSIIIYILFLLCYIYIIRNRIDKKKNEERHKNGKTSKQDIDEQEKHEDRTELIRQCILNIGDILKEESYYIP